MPKCHTRGFVLHVEQIQLLAQFAMVALFGFFNALNVFFQLLFIGPSGAVNALQLLVFRIATPVRTRQFGQFKRF